MNWHKFLLLSTILLQGMLQSCVTPSSNELDSISDSDALQAILDSIPYHDCSLWDTTLNIPHRAVWKGERLIELQINTNNCTPFTNKTPADTRYFSVVNIAPEIKYLTELKVLDLSNNQIQELPKEIGDLKNLEVLKLSNNLLQSLPKELHSLQQLRTIFLNGNSLTVFPLTLETLSQLDTLDISNNFLKQGQHESSITQRLKFYHTSPPINKQEHQDINFILSKNTMEWRSLRGSVDNNHRNPIIWDSTGSITGLNFFNLRIENIPKNINAFPKLRTIILNGFRDSMSISQELWEIKSLEHLVIRDAKLHHIPNNICNSTKLTSLEVPYNQLSSLPTCIDSLNIQIIDIINNPFQEPPSILYHTDKIKCAWFTIDESPQNWDEITSLYHGRPVEPYYGLLVMPPRSPNKTPKLHPVCPYYSPLGMNRPLNSTSKPKNLQ